MKIKKIYISGANELTFECYNSEHNLVEISIEIGEYFRDKHRINCVLLNFTDKYIIYTEENKMYDSDAQRDISYSSILSFDYEDFKTCVDISK